LNRSGQSADFLAVISWKAGMTASRTAILFRSQIEVVTVLAGLQKQLCSCDVDTFMRRCSLNDSAGQI
jgi:hypothetical protein